jgi:hypothetical protein
MVSLSGTQLVVLVVAVLLTVVVVGIFIYLANRLRHRRDQILGELSNKPHLVQDRAYNRIEMARREAGLLAKTGADLSRAQEQIAEAQAAFDMRQFPRAYELAQSAHESLVNVRQRGPLPSGAGAATPVATNPGPGPRAATPPMAKNRAESHFQISLLESDLAAAKGHPTSAAAVGEAEALRQQAQGEFDRSNYGEAFRLALRGRRSLGSVETLAPTPGAKPGVAPTNGESPADAAGLAEKVAGAGRCSKCGYPLLPDDKFCRGCGASQTPANCPSCGAPRLAGDTFCGRCGAAFAA